MGKSQYPSSFNWSSTNPVTAFLPSPGPNCSVAGNSPPSGTLAGTMATTATIYTNIIGVRQHDTQGLEITWTGTPTGTITVMCSISGLSFYALTFSPVLTQPSGSGDGYLIRILQPFQYMFLKYVNASGSGSITAYSQCKAYNS